MSLFLINLQACGLEASLKSDSNTCTFPMKFAKFLKAPSVKNICEHLLLYPQAILFTMHEKDITNEALLEYPQTYMMEFFGKNS